MRAAVLTQFGPSDVLHLDEVERWREAGTLRTVVDRVFPSIVRQRPHRYAESGAKTGAVVITLTSPATP